VIGHILELILMAGAIGPAIIGVAYGLWWLGVRDPFYLTVGAFVIGGAAGWALNTAIEKFMSRRRASGRKKP
jgi:hypothetical protein